MSDSLQKLYDAGSKHYDLGEFGVFQAKMQNADSRKKFYDTLSNNFDLGQYDEYESKILSFPTKSIILAFLQSS